MVALLMLLADAFYCVLITGSILTAFGVLLMCAFDWDSPWQPVVDLARSRTVVVKPSTSIILEVCEVCGIEYRPMTMPDWEGTYCPQHEQQARAIPSWGDARLFWLFECHKCARIQPHGKCDTHDMDGLRHSKIRYYETDEDGWRRELLELPIGTKSDRKSNQIENNWLVGATNEVVLQY